MSAWALEPLFPPAAATGAAAAAIDLATVAGAWRGDGVCGSGGGGSLSAVEAASLAAVATAFEASRSGAAGAAWSDRVAWLT